MSLWWCYMQQLLGLFRHTPTVCTLLCLAYLCESGGSEDVLKNKTEGPFVNLFNPKYVLDVYHAGLHRLKAKAFTDECKAHIEFEYMKQFRVVSEERPYPFEDIFFHSQCNRTHQDQRPLMPVGMKKPPAKPTLDPSTAPPNDAAKVKKDPADVAILYVVLVHDHAAFAERLILALDEPQHTFVVHVDLKAPEVYESLLAFKASSSSKENALRGSLHIIQEGRQSVNWGGFSVVNATLNAMRYASTRGIPFDYMIDISGTTYPLVDNLTIRKQLAEAPGQVYMDVQSNPSRPQADMWHSYVECDGSLHRIARLTTLRGMNMHVGSQWFALPKHVVHWFLHNQLPLDYIHYAKRVVVADEHYFATLFKNSPYCEDHIPRNMLFVLFDKWENEKKTDPVQRNAKKCLHPDPNHCGRSPTTLTTEYTRLLRVSQHLFARKFDPTNPDSIALLDEIDRWRQDSSHRKEVSAQTFMVKHTIVAPGSSSSSSMTPEEVAENNSGKTATGTKELDTDGGHDTCLRMGPEKKQTTVVPCSAKDPYQWFTLGRCTGSSEESGSINMSDSQCGMFVNVKGKSLDSDSVGDSGSEGGEGGDVGDKTGRGRSKDTAAVLSASASASAAAGVPQEQRMACQLRSAALEDIPVAKSRLTPQPGNAKQAAAAAADLCLDISGESPQGGAPIIGWDCTGNWNQLFHISTDCTISAVQPNVIAEVRGLPMNVTRCIASKAATKHASLPIGSGSPVRTAECISPSPFPFPARVSNSIEKTNAGSSDGEENEAVALQEQRWQILPKDGSKWKRYALDIDIDVEQEVEGEGAVGAPKPVATTVGLVGEDEDEEL